MPKQPVGKYGGSRPGALREDPEFMARTLRRLHARGLGSPAIAGLTGYCTKSIARKLANLGLRIHDPGSITRAIVANLPDDLRVDCNRVLTRSRIVKERRKVQAGETQARYVHKLGGESDGLTESSA